MKTCSVAMQLLGALLCACVALSAALGGPAAVEVDTTETPEVRYAFNDFSNIEEMAEAMAATKFAAFEYTLKVSNSIALGIASGYGGNVAKAKRKADVDSNFDPNLVYPLAGIYRKGIFDNLVLDREIRGTLRTIHFTMNLTESSDAQKPNGGIPASYGYAVLYSMDVGNAALAGKLFAIAPTENGPTVDSVGEALSVAVQDQGCKVVFPVLEAGMEHAEANDNGGLFQATLNRWPTLAACFARNGVDPAQEQNPAFAKDLTRENWPKAVEWATALLEGTPLGAGTENLAEHLSVIYDNTRFFGNAERAATALAVNIIQEGPVQDAVISTIEGVIDEVGCQPIIMALYDAKGLCRAMGTSETFLAAIKSSQPASDCLNKGLLAYQYLS